MSGGNVSLKRKWVEAGRESTGACNAELSVFREFREGFKTRGLREKSKSFLDTQPNTTTTLNHSQTH